MSMNLCPNCGRPISDDDEFCPGCGTPVSAQQNQPASVQEPQESQEPQEPADQSQNIQEQSIQTPTKPQPPNIYVQKPVQNFPAVQSQNTNAAQPAVQNTDNNQSAALNQSSPTELSNVNITAEAPLKGGKLALVIFGMAWTVFTAIVFIYLLANDVFSIPIGLVIGIGAIMMSRPAEINVTNDGIFIIKNSKNKKMLTWNMINSIQYTEKCITVYGGSKTYKFKYLPNSVQLGETMNQLLQQSRS